MHIKREKVLRITIDTTYDRKEEAFGICEEAGCNTIVFASVMTWLGDVGTKPHDYRIIAERKMGGK